MARTRTKAKKLVLEESPAIAPFVKEYSFTEEGDYLRKGSLQPISHGFERFLIVNDILHGRVPGYTLYGGECCMERVASLMGDVANAEEYVKAVQASTERDLKVDLEATMPKDLAQVFTNYFRMGEYAVLITGDDALSLQQLLSYDRQQRFDPSMLRKTLPLLFECVNVDTNCGGTFIQDGVVTTNVVDEALLSNAVYDGYVRYRDGIPEIKKTCYARLRKWADLSAISLQATDFVKLFQSLALNGLNPGIWIDILISMPDYAETFVEYGCIAEPEDMQYNAVIVAVPDQSTGKSQLITLSVEDLRVMLRTSQNALSGLVIRSGNVYNCDGSSPC